MSVSATLPKYPALFRWLITGIGILLMLVFTWQNRFLQDDAFISFRYAQHLSEGQGLVFNPDERVEGYTNLLWTLYAAVLFSLDVEPELGMYRTGMLLYAGSLALLWLMATGLFRSSGASPALAPILGFLPVLATGFNYSFSAYATGGLETALEALLTLGLFSLFAHLVRQNHLYPFAWLGLGMLSSLALLNRLDAALAMVALGLGLLLFLWRSPQPIKAKILTVVAWSAPIAISLILWTAWRWQYYGAWLPNTFYVKMPGTWLGPLVRGSFYVALFGGVYILPPLLYLLLTRRRNLRKMAQAAWPIPIELLPIGLFILLKLGYILKVGGDFMEFRFLVALIPLFYLLGYWLCWKAFSVGPLLPLTAVLILAGLLHKHVYTPRWQGFGALESIPMLDRHLRPQGDDWIGIGQALHAYFATENMETGVKLAVSPAGAIPYFSQLYSIDMLGLNDAWIARNGLAYKNVPGHQKITDLAYLQRRSVNLLIGHPLLVPADTWPAERERLLANGGILARLLPSVPEGTRGSILEIPIAPARILVVWYLNPHPDVERQIREGNWMRYEVPAYRPE